MSGAPLSQYLHVLRKKVIEYHPDLIIVLLIHNDFDESFMFKPGRYTSSFLKLKLDDGVVAAEIQPQPYHRSSIDGLRLSATFRYLHYTQGVRLQILRDLVFGAKSEGFQANIDVKKEMELLTRSRVATDYVFAQMNKIVNENGIDLVLVMDGHRQAIYGEAPEDWTYGPLALNALAAEMARRYDLPFIDLHEHFKSDWQKRGLRFEYETNWHWNALASKATSSTACEAADFSQDLENAPTDTAAPP
jgi:hypothetical protein